MWNISFRFIQDLMTQDICQSEQIIFLQWGSVIQLNSEPYGKEANLYRFPGFSITPEFL